MLHILYVSVGRLSGTILSSQEDHKRLRKCPGGGWGFKWKVVMENTALFLRTLPEEECCIRKK
jgi:hypothetical protein